MFALLFNGFLFGMILQIAIGPVCLFVFNTATSDGFFQAFWAVLAVVIADGLFIALAIAGIERFINRKNVMHALKTFGALVLFFFGLELIVGQFGVSLLPSLGLGAIKAQPNSFLAGFFLTLSNPLSILFWAGVFSAKVAEKQFKHHELIVFSVGCLSANLIFLTFIAVLGSVVNDFLSPAALRLLNMTVGIALICFGYVLVAREHRLHERRPLTFWRAGGWWHHRWWPRK
ncbi:MAG: LysE family transporter [Patescibacteria group bacterium]|nr:LysE family transporter [Patescibacteria group bacterium]